MEQNYASPLTVTEANFDRAVLQSETPVLVDFSAAWCGPCRAIAPVIDALAVDYGGRLTVATVDIDDNPGLANRYRIRSVPTASIFLIIVRCFLSSSCPTPESRWSMNPSLRTARSPISLTA